MKTEPAVVLTTETIPERYIDPQEAARFLTISPKTLTRLAQEGLVPAHAIGDRTRRRWRFLKSELDTWMHGRLHSNRFRKEADERLPLGGGDGGRECKNRGVQESGALDDFMIEELLAWYNITPYKRPEDWVFASDSPRAGVKRGKQPYWPSTIMRHFIQPAATKLGIRQMSWHTFRHTYSTLLHGNGEDPKVVQELLRHSSIKVTMDIYTQAVTGTKRKAQSRVIEMIAPKKKAEAVAPA